MLNPTQQDQSIETTKPECGHLMVPIFSYDDRMVSDSVCRQALTDLLEASSDVHAVTSDF
jgi:hypothetical protein